MKWKKRLERKERGGGGGHCEGPGGGEGTEGHDMISNPTRFIFLEVGISGT